MLGPQRISLHIRSEQHRSYSESALPLTMTVAKKFRALVEPRLKLIPTDWPFDDRVLVLLAKNLSVDVKRFYESNGPSLMEMFNPDQIQHLDQDFVKVLGDLLDVSILESLVTKTSVDRTYGTKTRRCSKKKEHWTATVGKDTWFAMARWAKQNSKLSPKARNFLYNIGVSVSTKGDLSEAQDKWAKQLFQHVMSNVFDVKKPKKKKS